VSGLLPDGVGGRAVAIRRFVVIVFLFGVLGGVAACANGPNTASIDRCENFKSWDDPSQPGNCY
jgi:hypothetical protein